MVTYVPNGIPIWYKQEIKCFVVTKQNRDCYRPPWWYITQHYTLFISLSQHAKQPESNQPK